ncbi:neuronal PAS domain-containing protein 1-like [Oryctolagus cuniculus]|uniref:neuronal PAS domain-containing protein 1-like n=1 Tax=Oryctolagus cuniculus TaxID=9986 RepID=UPI003879F08D
MIIFRLSLGLTILACESSLAEDDQTPLDAFQLPATHKGAPSPEPEPTGPEPPGEEKQPAPQAKNEDPQPQEDGQLGGQWGGGAVGQPRPAATEFTSVIRAGPWGLASPEDPPPSLLHAGFLPPPVMRGLCAPGTIRYSPAELGLVYPHLQRLGPGAPLPEAIYPTLGLPYPGPAGTRAQRKGD